MLLGKGARSGTDVRTVLRRSSVNAGATSPEMDSPTRPTPFAMSERNIVGNTGILSIIRVGS
jgi:hypothetical protein